MILIKSCCWKYHRVPLYVSTIAIAIVFKICLNNDSDQILLLEVSSRLGVSSLVLVTSHIPVGLWRIEYDNIQWWQYSIMTICNDDNIQWWQFHWKLQWLWLGWKLFECQWLIMTCLNLKKIQSLNSKEIKSLN